MKTTHERKLKIKEKLISENYYLSIAMINDNSNEILKRKEKINKLIKEYLNLLESPIDFM
jgi:hypothetical protein